MLKTGQRPEDRVTYIRTAVQGLFSLLIMAAIIIFTAGRVDYWQGWVFSGIAVLRLVVSSLIFSAKPELIGERARPGPGTKWWDRVFYTIYIPVLLLTVIVSALDRGRFGWTDPLPASVYAAGIMVHLIAHGLNMWAMWTNPFFSTTVRIQTDRGHYVVRDGPYGIVRHPGYVGGILLQVSTPLVLDSLWAFVPSVIIVVVMLMRTFLEDGTLYRELPGYADYTGEVKYRLVPGIW